MKFRFVPKSGWPCPWGNIGNDQLHLNTEGFLDCDGVQGLLEKLQRLIEENDEVQNRT